MKSKIKDIMLKLLEENQMMLVGITAAVVTFGQCNIKFTLEEDELVWTFVTEKDMYEQKES